ncbi:MAG: restriction endonuclease subunit S [Acidobacteria bacterium]|nr:restriction endonuclease subunit S [Acidobacteriota bacterium]
MIIDPQIPNGLPKSWGTVVIDEVAEINPALPISNLPEDTEVSFLPMKAVEEESGFFNPAMAKKYVEVRKGYTPFVDGDVIFAKITPCMENGKAAVVNKLINGIGFGSTEFHVMRAEPRALLPQYLFFFVIQKAFRKEAQAKMTGSAGQKRVPTTFIQKSPIPIPPLAEQRRIVAKIEELFTKLDAGVASLKAAKKQLKRYRQSVLKAAVEGELTRAWREKHKEELEPASFLLERILRERRAKWEADQLAKMQAQGKTPKDGKWKTKYQESAVPETTEFPALPYGWTWITVEQAASTSPNSITDGPFGSNLKTEHYTSEGPRVIRLQNVGDGLFLDARAHISQTHFERLSKHRVYPGDLVIAALGEKPPRACVIPESVGPAIVKADCIRLNSDTSLAMPHYLNFVLNSEPTRKRTSDVVHGIGRPRLNLGEIKAIVLPLPPLGEQVQIVAEVERRLSVADEIEATLDAELKRAERLRQSILKRAFEGKLVPQDPNDEPASALLERIKAERSSVRSSAFRRSGRKKTA